MMCQKATRVTQRGSLQILCISGTVATREALVAFHEMVNSVVIAPEFAYKHKYSSPPPPVSAPAVSIYIDKNPSSSFPTFSFPTFFPGWYIVLVVIGLVSTFRSMNQRSSASRLPSRSLPNDSTMEFLEAASQPDPEDQVPDNTEGEGIPKPN